MNKIKKTLYVLTVSLLTQINVSLAMQLPADPTLYEKHHSGSIVHPNGFMYWVNQQDGKRYAFNTASKVIVEMPLSPLTCSTQLVANDRK